MSRGAFMCDEIRAAGYRLAGAEVFCPAAAETHSTFVEACAKADVVMITAETAGHLPAALLAEAQTGTSPLVMVVEDVRARVAAPDLEKQMHTILGLDA